MIDFEASLEITPALVRFKRLAGRFSDFRPVLGGRVDVAARRYIREQFLTEGRKGVGGGGWEALSPLYLKSRQFPNKPILRQTDSLFDTLTQRGHPGQDVVLEPHRYALSVSEGSEVYARFIGHQFGRGGRGGSLPQRQVIPDPPSQTFIDEIRAIVRSYVVEGET